MKRKPDIYDKEIKRLTKLMKTDGSAIYDSWRFGTEHSPLFDTASSNRHNVCCGCLTQVRDRTKDAETGVLTKAIRADTHIPTLPVCIEVKHLSRFAYWQRKLDKLFNRAVPK